MALILVVDDEPLMRRTIRAGLEKAGHQVEEAQDGEEGLRRFTELRPDLVITDIVMPEREGVETIRAIRAASPNTPIIAMSGGGSAGAMLFLDIADKLGATRTLPKPIRNAELLATVAHCLAKGHDGRGAWHE